jgi:hypothetical protein
MSMRFAELRAFVIAPEQVPHASAIRPKLSEEFFPSNAGNFFSTIPA